MNWQAYYRLARFDKPVGSLLLWAPVAWALWFANQGKPALKLILLFCIGTFLMRSAGCVVNDIADRHIDKHVRRTRNRPVTSGEITLRSALIFLALLLLAALLILLQLPVTCICYALFALAITIIYPLCKRFFHAPQVVLGLAFSMGIPMVYVASDRAFDMDMLILLLINLLWTIAYDTQYAMADREDDLQIGVKSTAVILADRAEPFIVVLQCIAHFLWIPLALAAGLPYLFLIFWLLAGGTFIYQYYLLKKPEEKNCLTAFRSNAVYGLIMWFALIAGY